MSISIHGAAKAAAQSLVIVGASFALATAAQAQSHVGGGVRAFHAGGGSGWHGGGHYAPRSYYGGYGGWRHGGRGWVWGGVGLGVGLGLASYYNSYPYYPYYVSPGYVVSEPPVVYDVPQPVYNQPVPARSSQPVIYPRNGQSTETTDADANACSEWAGRQPNATSDSSVFRRGVQACMDARGYTVR